MLAALNGSQITQVPAAVTQCSLACPSLQRALGKDCREVDWVGRPHRAQLLQPAHLWPPLRSCSQVAEVTAAAAASEPVFAPSSADAPKQAALTGKGAAPAPAKGKWWARSASKPRCACRAGVTPRSKSLHLYST